MSNDLKQTSLPYGTVVNCIRSTKSIQLLAKYLYIASFCTAGNVMNEYKIVVLTVELTRRPIHS